MEIGSFIDLQLPCGKEYYSITKDIARLNCGRAAIYHATRVLGCNTVWLPYYQCDTVRGFLKRKKINIRFYHIDCSFNPIDIRQQADEAVVIVNYYGIMSSDRMTELISKYDHVIVDNSQAFFCKPIENAMNVYSARKFVGVPDGAYVIGKNAEKYISEYPQGFSSDTALFLLQRVEYGCEGKTYESRMLNEHRIDSEDTMKMSALTMKILDGTDYGFIKAKRKENFETACILFEECNRINPKQYIDNETVPMVYPLVVEDDDLLERMLAYKHFQGHWWSYLLDEMPMETFEHWISRYIIPITIDQRYEASTLKHIKDYVKC